MVLGLTFFRYIDKEMNETKKTELVQQIGNERLLLLLLPSGSNGNIQLRFVSEYFEENTKAFGELFYCYNLPSF